MAKRLALFALLFCLSTSLQAGLGIQGGVGMNRLKAPTGIQPGDFTGFAAGLVFETSVGPFLSIQPEAIFILRGSDIVGASSATATTRYNTIEVPVFAVLKLGTLRVFGGPNFDFNFGHKLTSSGGINFIPKAFDVGFAVGVGLEFGPVFINGRYLGGLGELNTASNPGWKSGGFLFLAGLKI